MFTAPPLIYISNRELSENTADPLLDIDALMTEESWDIISRTNNRSIYKKQHTDYDIVDIQHNVTNNGTHQFTSTLPIVSSKYAFTRTTNGNINMFNYMSDFIDHYNEQRNSIQPSIKPTSKL